MTTPLETFYLGTIGTQLQFTQATVADCSTYGAKRAEFLKPLLESACHSLETVHTSLETLAGEAKIPLPADVTPALEHPTLEALASQVITAIEAHGEATAEFNAAALGKLYSAVVIAEGTATELSGVHIVGRVADSTKQRGV